jgi:hypothetical protein
MALALKPVTITAATTLSRNVHAGTVTVLNSTTGRIITLPASTGRGDWYEIFVSATVSSGSHVIACSAGTTNSFLGGVSISTDIAGVTFLANADDDTVTLNGSTTGGLAGSWVRFTDVVSGTWKIEGFLVSTGSEADPFSAAV